jgi:RNA polymerase sigma-70 factor, ECF subfamily
MPQPTADGVVRFPPTERLPHSQPRGAPMPEKSIQDERYIRAAAEFGAALERLARAYEVDPELRRDLLQDIHIALWRSLARFDGRCSERTWVYRVAHNIGASHVRRRHRIAREGFTTLDDLSIATERSSDDPETETGDRQALARLMALIHALAPVDRQVVLLYLEGLDATVISDITGFSPGAVATKLHRLKAVLARQFQQGGRHAD